MHSLQRTTEFAKVERERTLRHIGARAVEGRKARSEARLELLTRSVFPA